MWTSRCGGDSYSINSIFSVTSPFLLSIAISSCLLCTTKHSLLFAKFIHINMVIQLSPLTSLSAETQLRRSGFVYQLVTLSWRLFKTNMPESNGQGLEILTSERCLVFCKTGLRSTKDSGESKFERKICFWRWILPLFPF